VRSDPDALGCRRHATHDGGAIHPSGERGDARKTRFARWSGPWALANIGSRTLRYLCVLACVALVLPFAGCMREPETPLRIGTNVWIGSEPLYLARDLGRLDPAAVQLVEYPSASEVLRAFRNQAVDGMVISLDELFGLAVDGLQPRIILVVDVSHGADVVVGRGGMRTMHDLKGKSVAVESGALGAFVLSRALDLNGMQASDVNVVHLESNEQPSAFEKGQVDGAVTFDPYRVQFLQAGAKILFDSTQIPGEIVDVLAVRASVIEKRPEAIQALLTGWFGAIDYMNKDPADAARRMGIRQQTSGEQFLQAQQGLHVPSREENLKMLGGTTPELVVTGRRLMDLMINAKLLRASLDIERVLAPAPLADLPK
jgi:NitT/TauT family transport system substrate-binding protein